MKRYAWLAGGLSLSMGIVACGGSDSDEVADLDAGAAIKQLRDDVDTLGGQLGELDTRLDVLEAPKVPGSCSAGELCIPDGVSLASLGLQPIIKALCTRETTCCNAGELHYLYGNAVKTAGDCEATFADMINHGLVNGDGVFGGSVETIVRAAHALNDTRAFVELVPEAVAPCAAEIAATVCPRDAKPASDCASPSYGETACSLGKLVRGKEKAGDTCTPDAINECGDGLVCRSIGSSSTQSGICAPKASAGDRCTQESDCDDLYCHFASGTCRVYSKEGEDCAYIDPTFEDVDPLHDEASEYDPSTLAVDCELGLSCDPVSKKCVKLYCAAGSWCNDNSDCGNGLICSDAGSAELLAYSQDWGGVGVCVPGLADGATCVLRPDYSLNSNDCVSGSCTDPEVDGTYVCQKAAALGESCLSVDCARGGYCWDMDSGQVNDYRCVQEAGGLPSGLADGVYCGNNDEFCASGWCQFTGTSYVCATAQASGAACDPTAIGEKCGLHMYCEAGATPAAGTCKNYLQTGEVCDRAMPVQCEPGYSCQLRNEEFACVPPYYVSLTCNAYSNDYTR